MFAATEFLRVNAYRRLSGRDFFGDVIGPGATWIVLYNQAIETRSWVLASGIRMQNCSLAI